MEKDWKFEAKFQELCSYFDFEKVYDIMNYLGWSWNKVGEAPDVFKMRDVVKGLFKDVYYKGAFSAATGGFCVSRSIDEEDNTVYKLEFILESSEICEENKNEQ